MSNASRCRSTALRYARLAQEASDAEARHVYSRLAILWREMADIAGEYDRSSDARCKERLFEMIDAAAEIRRRVA